jgi:hypothetical protein
VEPQPEPGDAQFGDKIETADSGADDRNRLTASVCHGTLPVDRQRPAHTMSLPIDHERIVDVISLSSCQLRL